MSDSDRLLDDLSWPPPPMPSRRVGEAIRKECGGERATKARGLSAMSRLGLSLLLCASVLAFVLLRHDALGNRVQAALFGVVGWGFVEIMVLWFGLVRPPGKRPARHMRLLLAIVVPVLFLGYLTWSAGKRLPLGEFFAAEGMGHAFGCGSPLVAVWCYRWWRDALALARHGPFDTASVGFVGGPCRRFDWCRRYRYRLPQPGGLALVAWTWSNC